MPCLRVRASVYIVTLLAINFYFVQNLFFVDFTNNMQTNAGSFMAISRFIIHYWPHLDWFPWWFGGEPFENTYTPMLHFLDAAFAGITGCSPARAFNFVTAFFFVTGPVFLFLFSWRVSKFLETSFFAALMYSLFSSSVVFQTFRHDVGGMWNPWRIRVLVGYGEGPHTVVLSFLPLVLLAVYLAVETRRYVWAVAAGLGMSFLVLVNAFGAVDLAVGCACLILALKFREVGGAAFRIAAIGISAYLLASPFLTPTLVHTISINSRLVGGDFRPGKLLLTQCVILVGLLGVWLGMQWIPGYFLRFSLLFAFVFVAITAAAAVWNRAALPQPHRYSLEMDLALPLALAFVTRPLILRLPRTAYAGALVLVLILAVHQTKHFRRYARTITQGIDVTQTIEYKVAKALDRTVGESRAFVAAEAGTWLNVFSDTPQMNSGHEPFNPNWVEAMATYAIYSGENTGTHDADISTLWLKAFGCHAIYVPGPKSRVADKPFQHPEKFEGVLPVLWHEEDDTIYAVPQRTRSLAHVVPEDAIVKHRPVNGLDIGETTRYVTALNDPTLPASEMIWRSPSEGHVHTTLRPGQVLSVQVTYDKGWVAVGNGHVAKITRDGIGLTEIQAPCDGDCDIDLVFEGGLERRICRFLSVGMLVGTLLGGFVAFRKRRLY
ncbi:MAG: hypothetical protein M3Y27_19840 [Acidobacteriota bacterium]|nr:hypothetical protein [Acidobacteriota bacterium]